MTTQTPYIPPAELVSAAEQSLSSATADELAAAEAAYLRYGSVTAGRSAVTGAVLPAFSECRPLVRAGWLAVVKVLAVLLVLGCVGLASPAMAQEVPADVPRVVQLAPVPVPAHAPTRAECFRWDRSRRNWTAVGVVGGALATTGGLVSALGSVGEDKGARVAVAVSSAVLAAVGALAAYESGEYASVHRERCTVLPQ